MIENGNYDRIDINLFSAYHLQKKNKSFDRDQFCGASTIGKKGNNMIWLKNFFLQNKSCLKSDIS